MKHYYFNKIIDASPGKQFKKRKIASYLKTSFNSYFKHI